MKFAFILLASKSSIKLTKIASLHDFSQQKTTFIHINNNGKKLTAAEQIKFLEELITKYPIDSIEDGLDENDWDNWVYPCQGGK